MTREFNICVYCVGLECRNPQKEKPEGAIQTGVVRFCGEDVSACDSTEIVHTSSEAEKRQKELGIALPDLPPPHRD